MLKIKDSTTVIFSTHILSDVERICDHVAILNKGSIALSGTLSEIKSMHGKDRLLLEFASNDEIQKFKSSDGIKSLLKDSEETNMEIVLHGKDLQKKNLKKI